MPIPVHIAVEDDLSEAVLRRVLRDTRRPFSIQSRFPKGRRTFERAAPSGHGFLRARMRAFNRAARQIPIIVLTDLDTNPCAATLAASWLGERQNPNLLFRVAIREVEAWLLADPDSLAEFLHVRRSQIPGDAEALPDPKLALVQAARHSRSMEVRRDMAPPEGSTARVGPYFRRLMTSFAQTTWDIDSASRNSTSLRRAVACFRAFSPVPRPPT